VSTTFRGKIDIKDSVPDWEPFTQPLAPDGAPNVRIGRYLGHGGRHRPILVRRQPTTAGQNRRHGSGSP
jgi:hypothetical protein